MEIDLNHVVEEQKTQLIASLSSSYSSSSFIYHELWHACAGPLTFLPKKGSLVVYFPQGHLEQLASSSASTILHDFNLPTFDLPPQIFCKVSNVQLLANKENDEVYAQVALLPQQVLEEGNLERHEAEEEMGLDDLGSNFTPTMFCKTLTASDTSSHGGFSIPRRAAENCFPPLDHKQERPSQELAAKDLHGVEWKFRHIYRGQPRRHLLTTGWSNFISKKNLVSGDAVLFLRAEDGELRLGIRRAAQLRNLLPDSDLATKNTYYDVLSHLARAVSTKSIFHVLYNPRGSSSEFVIPYEKYITSINNHVAKGMRFSMSFKMEDTGERRCNGIVTGISDLDPYQWPNSKWRCLTVRWAGDITNDPKERVSPWEIEPCTSTPSLSIPLGPKLKKPRIDLPQTPSKNPITDGAFLESDRSMRSFKVLQGQERFSFTIPQQNEVDKAQSTSYTGFSESARFPKVLQGQEIFPSSSLVHERRTELKFIDSRTMHGRPTFQSTPIHENYIKLNYGLVLQPCFTNLQGNGVYSNMNLSHPRILPFKLPTPPVIDTANKTMEDDEFSDGTKLFGFSLSREIPIQTHQKAHAADFKL